MNAGRDPCVLSLSQALVAPRRVVSMGVIHGNSYYTFVDASSWTNGESNANALGGHLITINDVDEYNWAESNLWSSSALSSLGRDPETWSYVGFNDASSEGTYTWSSGESSDWNPITDLIHPQNWYLQQGHFGAWDYGIQPHNGGWDEEIYDPRIGNIKTAAR